MILPLMGVDAYQTPSVARFFPSVPTPRHVAGKSTKTEVVKARAKTPDPKPAPCQHLRDGVYEEYILRTQTRSLGGISPMWRGRIARQLFPYKPFPPLRSGQDEADETTVSVISRPDAPVDGNVACEERKWSLREQLELDHALAGWARWIVDYGQRIVKSAQCEGTTLNVSGICDMCQMLGEKDAGFKKAVTRV